MAQSAFKVRIGYAGLEVGTLWFETAGGREHSSFQYAASWLDHPRGFAIAPALALDSERKFFKAAGEHGSPLPPPIADTTPDLRAEISSVRILGLAAPIAGHYRRSTF
ncbi:HipA N-terminal domain-containing protein [Agrobacterium leguminum]|uniref:HipA N-terminal domain-containing protein n=1 Tax=Agrobacterium leguminum TaxID=2792015 RepID=UPI0033130852